jgi:general secretion pathway protein C
METLFRKYFWAVNLLFILLVALIAARTVNLFTEAALTRVPTAAPSGSRTHAAKVDAPTGLNLEKLADLTGMPLPKPEVAETPGSTPYDPNAAPVKTSLRVKLLGTLDATDPRWSLASIQDMTSQTTATYMNGDTIQNAEIVEIERERVIINNNGRREYIDDEAGNGVPVATVAPPIRTSQPVRDPAHAELGQGIKALDDNNYEIPRDTVDNALSNLNSLAMQARIVPAFKDGKAEGFRLFSIRPDSLYSKIGIVNGDVLKRINGFDLNSPEKALEVYQKLKDSSRIDIEIDRNGSTVHKTYTIH